MGDREDDQKKKTRTRLPTPHPLARYGSEADVWVPGQDSELEGTSILQKYTTTQKEPDQDANRPQKSRHLTTQKKSDEDIDVLREHIAAQKRSDENTSTNFPHI